MSQDVLDSGTGVRRGSGRWRRPAAVAGVAVLAVSGFWLAGRSNPDPVAAPAPTPASTAPAVEVPPELASSVVAAAVGAGGTYLLVGRCPDFTGLNCAQELLVGSGDGRWQPSGVTLPKAGHGFATRLLVGDGVAVVDDDAQAAYLVRGTDVVRRPLALGRPVAGWSPGLVLDEAGDQRQMVLFDPVTGARSPLATQPPVGVLGIVRQRGGVLVALGYRDRANWIAVSRDGGRRWETARMPELRPEPQTARLAIDAVGTVYLLVGAETYEDVKNEFTSLWRYADRTWTDVTPRRRPRSASSIVAHDSTVLITEETGGLWQRQADGTLRELPDGPGGLRPTYLIDGPSEVLLAYATDADNRSVVLTSTDDARSWSVFAPR